MIAIINISMYEVLRYCNKLHIDNYYERHYFMKLPSIVVARNKIELSLFCN